MRKENEGHTARNERRIGSEEESHASLRKRINEFRRTKEGSKGKKERKKERKKRRDYIEDNVRVTLIKLAVVLYRPRNHLIKKRGGGGKNDRLDASTLLKIKDVRTLNFSMRQTFKPLKGRSQKREKKEEKKRKEEKRKGHTELCQFRATESGGERVSAYFANGR